MCCVTCLFPLKKISITDCIPGSPGETLKARTIYCRIKKGNSKIEMGNVVNAEQDVMLEKGLPVFQVLFSYCPP